MVNMIACLPSASRRMITAVGASFTRALLWKGGRWIVRARWLQVLEQEHYWCPVEVWWCCMFKCTCRQDPKGWH